MRRPLVLFFLISSVLVSSAFASGEDTQDFIYRCNGLDPEAGSFKAGSSCVVSLRTGSCLSREKYLPEGYDVYVARRDGRKWTQITKKTHYESCAEESVNGVNRKMRFKLRATATYAVFLDTKGDGKPATRATVLGFGMAKNFKSFKLYVK